MPVTVKQFFLQAITPVHVGAGQGADSVVDLPVMRERASGHPILPASALKGVLRGGREDEEANQIFGYAAVGEEGEGAAAGLALTDARLLFLPVRSLRGTYALITCPAVLERWRRDAGLLGLKEPPEIGLPGDFSALLPPGSPLELKANEKRLLILEDCDLAAGDLPEGEAQRLAEVVFPNGSEQDQLIKHLAIVDCDVFDHFARDGLEVIARVQLEAESKTVKEGPWYEEAVPAEAIFYFFALAEKEAYYSEISERPYLIVGGGTSIGRGLVRVFGG